MSEFEWLDIFSDNLASLMKSAQMSQYELSVETGISQSTISKYINKQQLPGIKAIINISYALDCDISELIDFGEQID